METCIGIVTHYFNHLGVAVLSLNQELRINDRIQVAGHTTDFCQKAMSLEINHHQVEVGKPGEVVAMKMVGKVRRGDKVYLAPEANPTPSGDIQEQWPDEWER